MGGVNTEKKVPFSKTKVFVKNPKTTKNAVSEAATKKKKTLKDVDVGMSTVRDHGSLLQHLGLTVVHRRQKGY